VQEIVAGLASVDAAVAASAATIDASIGVGTGATTVAVGALNAVNTAGFISLNQNLTTLNSRLGVLINYTSKLARFLNGELPSGIVSMTLYANVETIERSISGVLKPANEGAPYEEIFGEKYLFCKQNRLYANMIYELSGNVSYYIVFNSNNTGVNQPSMRIYLRRWQDQNWDIYTAILDASSAQLESLLSYPTLSPFNYS
jgi:hypothetical protein